MLADVSYENIAVCKASLPVSKAYPTYFSVRAPQNYRFFVTFCIVIRSYKILIFWHLT